MQFTTLFGVVCLSCILSLINAESCVCTVWADNYEGFDGSSLSFPGQCEYTLAKTTQSFGDCDFDISVVNEDRYDNNKVTFVKSVHVFFKKENFQLGQDNTILVNDIIYHPTTVSTVKLTTGGANNIALRHENCELEVTLKNNDMVTVVVGGRYRENMTGLCGNCNGDREDDYNLANGDPPTAMDPARERDWQIGNSFLVTELREGLSDRCEGVPSDIPPYSCPRAKEEFAQTQCSPAFSPDGPFGDCLPHLPGNFSQYIVDSCITDTCAFANQESVVDTLRCRAFEVLAEKCSQAELPFDPNFRTTLNCSPSCPAGFDFSTSVSSCQPTCSTPTVRTTVCQSASPHAGCACSPGLIQEGNACILPENCGCTKKKRYIKRGDFILSTSCTKKYSCVDDDGSSALVTEDHDCGHGQYGTCVKGHGDYQCDCLPEWKDETGKCVYELRDAPSSFSPSTECFCRAWGDPHYIQFDGLEFDFQGICTFILSTSFDLGFACDFEVLVQNENRGENQRVSYTRDVYVRTQGVLFELRKSKVVYVNGEMKSLPYVHRESQVSIVEYGATIQLETACNVRVRYDGANQVYVIIPHGFGSNVTGLCGNCDGDQTNDLVTKDGQASENIVDVGNSWRVTNPSTGTVIAECPVAQPGPECPEEDKEVARGVCKPLIDADGVFSECINFLGVESSLIHSIYEACVMDVCFDGPHAETLSCAAFSELASVCSIININVYWRSEGFCEIPCPDNARFTQSMTGCPRTCAQQHEPEVCEREPVEGCQCLEGFFLDNGQCVPQEDCGCVDPEGNYMPRGSHYTSSDCSTYFTCEDDTLISRPTHHPRCGPHGCCGRDKNGNPVCICHEGWSGESCEIEVPACTCVANGDPRVVMFDKGRLWVNSGCKYTLAQSTISSGTCAFSVQMKTTAMTTHPEMSYVYEIDVIFSENIKVRLSQNLEVYVNNVPGHPKKFSLIDFDDEYQVSSTVWAKADADGIFAENSCGVRVHFDSHGEVKVTVPSHLEVHGLQGLCGNCDSNGNNDRIARNGTRFYQLDPKKADNVITRQFLVNDDSSKPNTSPECEPEN